VAVSGPNSSVGETAGRPKYTMNTVTRIGSPRKISMYPRISMRDGRNWMVSSVPSVMPISVAPTTETAETRSVAGRPSSRM
jgi:hypothetical protein